MERVVTSIFFLADVFCAFIDDVFHEQDAPKYIPLGLEIKDLANGLDDNFEREAPEPLQ